MCGWTRISPFAVSIIAGIGKEFVSRRGARQFAGRGRGGAGRGGHGGLDAAAHAAAVPAASLSSSTRAGAVFWPRYAMLVVADLHLEKGSAFARRGTLLPPYDSHATLARLEALIARLAAGHGGQPGRRLPRPARPAASCRPTCSTGCAGADPQRRWVWVTGNHDPVRAAGAWAVPPWPSCAWAAWCCATRPRARPARSRATSTPRPACAPAGATSPAAASPPTPTGCCCRP